MKLNSLQDVFVDVVKDLYSAEMQLVKALPKMAKAATTPKLKQGFEQHLEVTRAQAERLEQICSQMGEKPTGKKCVGMEGLIKEGEEVIEEAGDPAATDAALIVAAQKIEHYEIAGYGSAVTFAKILGNTQAARLLQRTLDEEKKTDEKLTQVAENNVNFEARDGEDEESSMLSRSLSRLGAGARRGPARGAGSRKASPSRKSATPRRKSTASASAANRGRAAAKRSASTGAKRNASAAKKTATKSAGRNKTAARNSSTSRKATGAAKKNGRKAPSKAAAAKGGRNSRRK